MFFASSCSCLWPIQSSQVLSREWRCCWSSADRDLTVSVILKFNIVLTPWRVFAALTTHGTRELADLVVKLEGAVPDEVSNADREWQDCIRVACPTALSSDALQGICHWIMLHLQWCFFLISLFPCWKFGLFPPNVHHVKGASKKRTSPGGSPKTVGQGTIRIADGIFVNDPVSALFDYYAHAAADFHAIWNRTVWILWGILKSRSSSLWALVFIQ